MKITVSCLFAALLTILSADVGVAKIVDKIVAQVNDEIITLSELEQAMKYFKGLTPVPRHRQTEAYRKQMLDILIDRKLAKAEAKRYGLTVPEKDLQKAVEDIRKKNGFADDAALSQALSKDGMTMEQLRTQISEQIQQDRLMALTVKDLPKVPDADIKTILRTKFQNSGKPSACQSHHPAGGPGRQRRPTGRSPGHGGKGTDRSAKGRRL